MGFRIRICAHLKASFGPLSLTAFSRGGFRSYYTSSKINRELRFRPLQRTSRYSPILPLSQFFFAPMKSPFPLPFLLPFPFPFPSLFSSPLLFSSLCVGCRGSCRVHTSACKWKWKCRNICGMSLAVRYNRHTHMPRAYQRWLRSILRNFWATQRPRRPTASC